MIYKIYSRYCLNLSGIIGDQIKYNLIQPYIFMCIIIGHRSFYSVLERESSPPQKYEPEKKKDEKPEKPKFRKPMPPPMDFNQLLKLAEEKKSAPVEVAPKPVVTKPTEGPDRPMTKKQRREYEEEMARRQRRLERMEAEKNGKRRKCLLIIILLFYLLILSMQTL